MRFTHGALIIIGAVLAFTATSPGYGADNSQQQRMKDCNAQASSMTGAALQQFMSSCLSGKPEAKHPNCNPAKSKPCGNSCIALDKVCHK